MPAHVALPLIALLTYLLCIFYFSYALQVIHAAVISGLLIAWTPILIVGSAIFLFKTLSVTGALRVIVSHLNHVSTHSVAQLMIVGWAFPFLIEGASGFGTPAALAAPILVGLGFRPVPVAALVLIMNSVPVSFGAVGTPIWFGFAGLDISESQQISVGLQTATIHTLIALIIVILGLKQILAWSVLKNNLTYIVLCVMSTVIPYLAVASLSTEFPSLIGGFCGLISSVLLARYHIGLEDKDSSSEELTTPDKTEMSLLKATFPLWGTIALLILTRIPQLELQSLLNAQAPSVQWSMGSLGNLSISASLVISINNILGTDTGWSHSLLYVPSLLPFLFVSGCMFIWCNTSRKTIGDTCQITFRQMLKPMIALSAALVFVKLMMTDSNSMVSIMGTSLASVAGGSWAFFAPFLGALGSFFSGSATLSNLTFAGVQAAVASSMKLPVTTVLALQSVGAALGNMVCINNIVAVSSVLGLEQEEGNILKRTIIPMAIYGTLAGVLGLLIIYW